MSRTTCFRYGATVLWMALVHAAAAGSGEGQPPPTRAPAPLVIVAEVDALIHPVSAEYMAQTIDRGDAAGAELIVFVLRTPGGLLDSTEAIVSRMLAAKTPIAIYVAPSGARAASAGFIITIAGDIAAMAPGTHIGAAHPVSGSGEKMDETMAKKAASDTAARVRTIAAKRNRNVTLAELAVTESRAFTDQEALSATPPLIDLVAPDLDALLERLEGRTVTRFDGGTTTLALAGARVERVEMTARQRILSAIAHPQVAYLLLTLGTLGLTIELWNPGSIVPGVVGGLCLLLAFFAFQILPVNYAGLGLIFFGLLLLVLEVKVASFGLLGIGGIVSLVFGSMILIDSPLPELQIGLRLILPIVLAFAAILVPLVRLAVASQVRRSVTGSSGMIGEPGLALTPIGPGETGQVRTRGEIWTATATAPIAEGDAIRVIGVQGLTLTVGRETDASREDATS
jgi:membrane-bound serine protease (ClpP class)